MVESKKIEFFVNLSQFEYKGHYFDFHNNYDCIKLLYFNRVIHLYFKYIGKEEYVNFCFLDSSIELFEFYNDSSGESLTIDNIYRGRILVDNKLVEIKEDIYGFFFLEFDNGQKLNFWCKGIVINKINKNQIK